MVATRPTLPCDRVDGPTAVYIAHEIGLPEAIVADMQERAIIGLCKYGVPLCAPWAQGLAEAYQELLDAVAYLLVAGDYTMAEQVCTLALALRHKLSAYSPSI